MTLTEKVGKIVAEMAKEDYRKTEAIKRAEELSDLFHDVKPVPYKVPIEQALGLPAYSK